MYDASDRAHVKDALRSARVGERQRLEIVRAIMGQSGSRAWIHDILLNCHLFELTFTGDSLQSAFREGERNIGLRLFADIMIACPQLYTTMMEEANGRASAAESRRDRTSTRRDDYSPIPTDADFDGYDEAGNPIDASASGG